MLDHHPIIGALSTLVLFASSVGCAHASVCPRVGPDEARVAAPESADRPDPHPPKAHPKMPSAERRVMRFDFVVSSGEAGKPDSSSHYELSLEEDHTGEVRIGSNIALSGQARMDTGLLIRCSFATEGDKLLLQTSTEMTSPEEGSAIRKIVANGNALVAPGKPALVASLEDPGSHKRYQVTVTATKPP